MGIDEDIVDQRVIGIADQYRSELGTDVGRSRSKAFVALGVAAVLDLHLDAAVASLCDGAQDQGIDALYAEEGSNRELTVWLFQGKYHAKRDGRRGFPTSELKKLVGTVSALFDPSVPFPAGNDRLLTRIEQLRSLVRDGWLPTARVVALSNGKRWEADGDVAIDPSATGFGDQVTWEHLGAADVVERLQATRPVDDQVQFRGPVLVDDAFQFRRVVVGRVAVSEVARLVRTHGDRLFERNIRRFLGGRNRVNRDIASTLADPERRRDFFFLNNGLTVLCNQFRHNALQSRDPTVRVSGLQVVNGQQTSATIRRLVDSLEGVDWSDATVLVRLYELEREDPDFVAAVTHATNSQNPVDLRDLRANDPVQRRLELGLRDLGFTYARHRGSAPKGAITPEEAAEAVLAVLREQPQAAQGRRHEHFGRLYGTIFTDDLSPAQVAAAVLVQRALGVEVLDGFERDALAQLVYGRSVLAWMVGEDLGVRAVTHSELPMFSARLRSTSILGAYRRYLLACALCGVGLSASLQDRAAIARRRDLQSVLRDLRTRTSRFLDEARVGPPGEQLADVLTLARRVFPDLDALARWPAGG